MTNDLCKAGIAMEEMSKKASEREHSADDGKPIMFGVVTTENIEQAIERAGTKAGNKGYDCALSVLETVNLLKSL